MKRLSRLPARLEQNMVLDIWLGRFASIGMAVGVITGVMCIVTGIKGLMGAWPSGLARLAMAGLVCTFVLMVLASIAKGIRRMFFYVPPDGGGYAFFVIDEQGRVTPAKTDTLHLKGRLLTVPSNMLLRTTVRTREERPKKVRLELRIDFESAPTAEGAGQLNWLFGRVLDAGKDMSQAHAVLVRARRDHPDLPFRFSAKFQGYPQLDL